MPVPVAVTEDLYPPVPGAHLFGATTSAAEPSARLLDLGCS